MDKKQKELVAVKWFNLQQSRVNYQNVICIKRKTTVTKFCAEKTRPYGKRYQFIKIVDCSDNNQCMKEYPVAPGLFTKFPVNFCFCSYLKFLKNDILVFLG